MIWKDINKLLHLLENRKLVYLDGRFKTPEFIIYREDGVWKEIFLCRKGVPSDTNFHLMAHRLKEWDFADENEKPRYWDIFFR